MKPILSAIVLLATAFVAFLIGSVAGGIPSRSAVAKEGSAPPTVAELKAEIENLKQLLPDQSHAMADVGYHFSNLWFAAQAANWPLAEFYWSETRAHLHWAVRIKPIRQDRAKRPIELAKILEALENSPFKDLQQSITDRNTEKFVAAYKTTLEGCYSCHKASEKPYLRPRIPSHPESQMINSHPDATWPR
jgi:hypothetical protein